MFHEESNQLATDVGPIEPIGCLLLNRVRG